MLKDILEKETLDENDIKIIMDNYQDLTDKDLIRLGFKVKETKKTKEEVTN